MVAELVKNRDEGEKAAIVFVHGFGGKAEGTWGEFPDLIAKTAELKGWAIYALGYNTSLFPDIRGIWSSDAGLKELAGYLVTRTTVGPLAKKKTLAFVAHSMGGLIVQRSLLDSGELADRTSHVVLFGTPSAGLKKAVWFRKLKQQAQDMYKDSEFIRELRDDWAEKLATRPPRRFSFWAVAGDRDQFVPPVSSIEPFPVSERQVVPGNHVEMVKPNGTDSLSYQLLGDILKGDAAPGGDHASARVAIESRMFNEAIATLEPNASALDDQHLVMLAIALDGVGRRADAKALLEARGGDLGTDPMGVLAGRLKRMWLVGGRKSDGEDALALYSDAYDMAVANSDYPQAMYHVINRAFMELAFSGNAERARTFAEAAIRHADQAGRDIWVHATKAEAMLYLNNPDGATTEYGAFVGENPAQWQMTSAYGQAAKALEITRYDEEYGKIIADTFGYPYED
ncbi:MAG: alpha/beta fold hydrolase [Actinobacteria bacterium]|nr:alpha/beta fold hydrolase [Actinomycetota bacterium]